MKEMGKKDIRWTQRFSNYKKALDKLGDAVSENEKEEMSDLEKEGLIQRFEYTFELAWKTLQDLFYQIGYQDIKGPNPVLRQALMDGYIKGEKKWREMKNARDMTSHIYDESTANEIASKITEEFYNLLCELKRRLDKELPKYK